MKHVSTVLSLIASLALGCTVPEPAVENADPASRAETLAQSSIIVDTHVDVPYRLEKEWVDVSEATKGGDFDYPRAVRGGLNAPFMSIYTPARLQETGGSRELADSLIDMMEDLEAAAPEKFSIARSVADVREDFARGLISLPMGNGTIFSQSIRKLPTGCAACSRPWPRSARAWRRRRASTGTSRRVSRTGRWCSRRTSPGATKSCARPAW